MVIYPRADTKGVHSHSNAKGRFCFGKLVDALFPIQELESTSDLSLILSRMASSFYVVR